MPNGIGVEFNSVRQMLARFVPGDGYSQISIEDADVPPWQRQVVWSNDEMGLLALSVIQDFPIGLVLLWEKSDGVRVPIDGRQRLTALRQFSLGKVAIPDLRTVPPELRKRKFKLLDGDSERGFERLDLNYREAFENFNPHVLQFLRIDEATARSIFVRLQGGKPLTKTEIRAALGGRVAELVTELTSGGLSTDPDDEEEAEAISRNDFFRTLNVRDVRKQHRNVCDILLHEYLRPDTDKHWSSLEDLYLSNSATFTTSQANGFKSELQKFYRAVSFVEQGERRVLPQLRSVYLIASFYRLWRVLTSDYAFPDGFSFVDFVKDFESWRVTNPDHINAVTFRAALSNAGYSANRLVERHDILLAHVFLGNPTIAPKDPARSFPEGMKIAIWENADHQCEFVNETDQVRCTERFQNFRDADADHFVKHTSGGPTTLENGRLLCQRHNRGRG